MSGTSVNALTAILPGLADPTQGMKSPVEYASQYTTARRNALELQKQQAGQTIGEILQQSTDKDGNVDIAGAQRRAAQAGPSVALAMQDMLKDTSVLRGQQLAQGVTRNTAVNNAIIGALNGDDAGLHDRVVGGLQSLVANGVTTQAEATKAALGLPSEPAQLRQRLQQIQTSLAPAELQQQQISGVPFRQTGPGGNTIGGTQDVRTGAVSGQPGQPGLPQGLEPSQTAAYQQWLKTARDYPDPANPTVTKHGTNETFLKDSGVPDQYVYPGGAPATPGTQPGTPSPLGTGRLPPALQNKPQAAPASAATPAPSPVSPAPAPTPAGSGISGPTPAQAATAAATKEQGVLSPPKFQAESDAGTQAQNQQAVLGNMLADTTQFTTGPLAGIVGKVRNMAGNLGLNINTDAQSAKESFNKLAAGLANAQGAGSDARMNVNISANPHEELSPAGVDLILRQLQGNSDYIRARATLAAKYPDKANFPAFQESIKDLDPRVFQLSRMMQPQRDTYWKSLDDATQKQLGEAIKKAKDMGVLGG